MPPKKILKIKKKLEKTSTPEESVFDIDIEKKAKTKVTDKVKKEAKKETTEKAKRETKATATEKEQSDDVKQEVIKKITLIPDINIKTDQLKKTSKV